MQIYLSTLIYIIKFNNIYIKAKFHCKQVSLTYDNYSPIDNYSPLLKSECSMQGMPVELRSLFMGYVTYFICVRTGVW